VFELVRNRIAPWRPLVTALVAGVVTAALCAVFLLPLLEAIPQSAEVELKEGQSRKSQGASGARALAALATDVIPYLHVRAWSSPNLGLIGAETAAVGSIVLALAIYAIWRKRSADTWFFAMLALFCIGAGVRWKPISDALQRVPLLHITHHDRLAFAGALCLVVLAAFAVDEILRRDDRRAAAITLAAVFMLLAAGTYVLTQRVVLGGVAGGYGRYRIFAELFFLPLAALLLMLPMRARWLLAALVAVLAAQRLTSELDTFSTYPARDAWPQLALFEPLRHVREPFRIVGVGTAFPPASNIFYGLEDVRGYEALTLFRFVQTWQLWNRPHGTWYHRVDDLTNPFLSLMNVRFAIQSGALPVPAGWRMVAASDGSALLENVNVLDRLFIPSRIALGDRNAEEIVDRMADLRDFRTFAWIVAPGDLIERRNGPGRITLRSYSAGGRYDFDADMQGDGWIVLSDSSWKGWRAYVDGKRVKMTRANAAFLSVYVAAGQHSVRIVYRPMSFVRGRAISLATLVLIVAAVVYRRRRGWRLTATPRP
jgi:hypothetical protein